MKITILIPILNEEVQILNQMMTIKNLQSHPLVQQVLFSDSGSTDQSLSYLKTAGFDYQQKSFQGSPSVGKALFQCIDRIETEKILILPIDVQIDDRHLDQLARSLLENPNQIYVFQKKYDLQSMAMKAGQWLLKFAREGLFKNYVWTNIFCISKNDLKFVPRIGFLEDVVFNDQLKKNRTIVRIKPPVIVSARKYAHDGPWLRLIVNILILGLFRTGLFKPIRLKKLYQLSKLQKKEGDFHDKNSIRRSSDGTLYESASFRFR